MNLQRPGVNGRGFRVLALVVTEVAQPAKRVEVFRIGLYLIFQLLDQGGVRGRSRGRGGALRTNSGMGFVISAARGLM
jgi:hypothetical protein